MSGVLFIPRSALQDKEEITMGQITIPIVRVSQEECLAKIDDIFKNVNLSSLLNMAVKADYTFVEFLNIIHDLYPNFLNLSRLEQSYFSLYLEQHYTLSIDYVEYEGIIPIGKTDISKKGEV